MSRQSLPVAGTSVPGAPAHPARTQPALQGTSGKPSALRTGEGAGERRSRTLLAAWLLLITTPLLALGLLLVRQQSLGAPATVAMQAAAALYAGGDPALAQQAYSQLVEQGGDGPELAHNLGAAALRAGDLATAVAALEEAQRLAPRDEGVVAALATAREAQQGSAGALAAEEMAPGVAPAAEGAGSSAMALLGRVKGEWLTANQVALGALGLWVAFGALVLAALAPGRWRTWALIALFPVSLGLGAALLILLT